MIPAGSRRSPVYTGTGLVSDYDFEFKVFSSGDIAVTQATDLGVESTLVLGSDYTVTLNPNQDLTPGGTITLTAPLPEDYDLVILGDTDYSQTTQLPNGGSYNATIVERAFDRLVIMIQQLLEQINRTLRLSATTPSDVSTELPTPEALSVIGWDATGLAMRNYDPGELGVAVSYAEWRTETFNGDGVDTTFVLTEDAGNASNIDLRVNNVPQTPGVNFSYDAVAHTITMLTGAPSAGTNNVVARYGQALPQGATPDLDYGSIV
jgi:hypothetical protein